MVFNTIKKISKTDNITLGNIHLYFNSYDHEIQLYVYFIENIKYEITYNEYISADLSYNRRIAPTIVDGKYYQEYIDKKFLFYIKEEDGIFDLYDDNNIILLTYKKGIITTEYTTSPFLTNVSNMFSQIMKIVLEEYDNCIAKIISGELYDKESFDKAFECMNIELVKINNKL